MNFYKKRVSRPDTPAQVAEREAYREAAALALWETHQIYAPLTAENFEKAEEYRTRRLAELLQ